MSGNATERGAARSSVGRRRVLCGVGIMFLTSIIHGVARAEIRGERRLSLYNPHTDERFDDVYWCDGDYVEQSRKRINWLMRDFHRDAVAAIDADLLDLLNRLAATLEAKRSVEILSGFRTPATNRLLQHEGHHAAARSEHLLGKAADIRIGGVRLKHLRRAALSFSAGGVGTYWRDGFVHVDVGPVRHW
jgi:uncharacterized protein YcbK (DUF882 family)